MFYPKSDSDIIDLIITYWQQLKEFPYLGAFKYLLFLLKKNQTNNIFTNFSPLG